MLVIQVEKFINKWSSTFRDKTYFVKNGRNSGGFCMSKKKMGYNQGQRRQMIENLTEK